LLSNNVATSVTLFVVQVRGTDEMTICDTPEKERTCCR